MHPGREMCGKFWVYFNASKPEIVGDVFTKYTYLLCCERVSSFPGVDNNFNANSVENVKSFERCDFQ